MLISGSLNQKAIDQKSLHIQGGLEERTVKNPVAGSSAYNPGFSHCRLRPSANFPGPASKAVNKLVRFKSLWDFFLFQINFFNN